MNTVKISIISVLLVLSQAAQGVKPAQAKQPAKPQSTAAQMRNALKGANAKFTGDFNRTVAEATEGEGVGAIIGLRQEGQAMVDNLYKAGEIVQTMADDLTDPLEVVLALGETNLKKAKVQSKYKKQALEVIAEVRAVAPKLVTVGIVAFLLYTYMGLSAQQTEAEAPKTKFEVLKAWAKGKCEPVVGKVGEMVAKAWWRGDIPASVIATPTTIPLPTQITQVTGSGQVSTQHINFPGVTPPVSAQPTTVSMWQRLAGWAGYTGTTAQ
jgi:hypothetical protein